MQATHNGRTYILTKGSDDLPNMRADLLKRGWDGVVYYGTSKATGRQRKDMNAIFYRCAKTGEFVSVF